MKSRLAKKQKAWLRKYLDKSLMIFVGEPNTIDTQQRIAWGIDQSVEQITPRRRALLKRARMALGRDFQTTKGIHPKI